MISVFLQQGRNSAAPRRIGTDAGTRACPLSLPQRPKGARHRRRPLQRLNGWCLPVSSRSQGKLKTLPAAGRRPVHGLITATAVFAEERFCALPDTY